MHITSKTDSTDVSPLNAICYMWWDIIPLYGQPKEPDHAALDATCLEVMRKTLALDSDACRENALHGLGHWHLEYPEQVKTTINQFLDCHPALQPELRAYALAARAGHVL